MKRSRKWRTAPPTRQQKRQRAYALFAEFMAFNFGPDEDWWRKWEAAEEREVKRTRALWDHWLGKSPSLTPASADDSINGTGRVVLPEKAIEDACNPNDRAL